MCWELETHKRQEIVHESGWVCLARPFLESGVKRELSND